METKLQSKLKQSFFAGVLFASLLISGTPYALADDLNKGFVSLSEGKPAEAIRFWTPLAENGDMVAQASLGLLYQTGQGTAKNDKQALKLFIASAKQGYPFAFTALGNSFHEGLGVDKNHVTAMVWFLLAAESDPNAALMANLMVSELTSTELDTVRSKASICKNSNYQNCDLDALQLLLDK